MKKNLLEKFYKEKIKIQIVLRNSRYYTGFIIFLDDSSLVFKDKFGNELPFDLDAISYVDVVNKGQNGN